MSESAPTQAVDNPRTIAQSASPPEESGFWAFVWLGIALAGGLFGLLLALTGVAGGGIGAVLFGASLGFFLGFLFAGIVAAPVVLVMAIASWAIRIEWWRALLAVIAGGATGSLSTSSIATSGDPVFPLAATGIAVPLAALLGSMGAGIAAVVWTWRMVQMMHAPDEHVDDAEAPVTNRFFRIAVLVAVIAIFGVACFGAVCLVRQAREEARRDHCRNNLRQIALCLHSYEAANGSLPPAYLTDKAGKPVLSWRVAAARYCFYHREFSKCMDPGQPWNSPKNAAFLGGLHAGSFVHCPSSGKKPENPMTDYVAVVGRDTLWPGKVPSDPKRHPRGILVVEWPESDIHWAEPRDITVDEFLDWFRRKPPGRGFLDWLLARRQEHDSFHPGCLLYVDAQGSVGELRNDTDVETVRKLLTGQSTAANVSPPVSGGR